MQKKFGYLGGCLVLIIAIIVGVGLRQQSAHQATPATAHRPVTQTSHVKTTHVATTKPWIKLKRPLQLPILMYHSISSGNNLRVPKQQFVQELTYLKQHHYRTLTAAEAIRALKTNTIPQKKVVWLTLDDAYKDNTKIMATLKKDHFHATINVITGFTHKTNHLSLAQLKQMKATGLVDFGSHTVHHLDLNALTTAQQRTEIINSKSWLDQHLHQTTTLLCYPAGRANAATHKLAKQAGYQLALTTQEGLASLHEGRYNLSRLRVTPGISTATFAALINVHHS